MLLDQEDCVVPRVKHWGRIRRGKTKRYRGRISTHPVPAWDLGLASVHTREEAYFKDRPGLHFRARRFHRLHAFVPSHFFVHKDDGNGALDMYDFHKEIMKMFVLFLFSIKLINLARRVKERMYAPGGIGFIAAEDNFGRVAKSQRIE